MELEKFCVSVVCAKHNKNMNFFCTAHESLLCNVCAQQEHQKCSGLLSLQEASKRSKESTATFDLEQNLNEVWENTDKGIHNLQQIQADIKNQEESVIKTIHSFREQINTHLDVLQERVLGTLKKKQSECNIQIESLLNDLRKKQETICRFKENMKEMKDTASDLQTFIGVQNMSDEVRQTTHTVKGLMKNSPSFNISFNRNQKLYSLIKAGNSLGEILVMSKHEALEYVERKVGQAQSWRPPIDKIDNIRLQLRKRLQLKEQNLDVTCCLILPNKQMLFVNGNGVTKDLTILNENGSYDLSISLPYHPFDATIIDDKRIAVSYNTDEVNDKEIDIVNFLEKRLEKSLPNCFGQWSWGISNQYGKLYIVADKEQMLEINMDGQILRKIKLGSGKDIFYITVYKDKIYYSDKSNIHCINMSGEKLWTVYDDRLGNGPGSAALSVDKYGNTFATGQCEHILMAISKDGQHKKILLDISNDLLEPQAVHYDKISNSLLICNRVDGYAALYNVLYS